MPCAMFQVLYQIAFERMQTEEGQKDVQADEVEEVLEEGGLIP